MAKPKKAKPVSRRLLVQLVTDLSTRLQNQTEIAEAVAVCCQDLQNTNMAARVLALAAEQHASELRDVAGFAEIVAAQRKRA